METRDFDVCDIKEEILSVSCDNSDMSTVTVKEEFQLDVRSEYSPDDNMDNMNVSVPVVCGDDGQKCLNDIVPPFCFVGIKMEKPDYYESDTSCANSDTKHSVEEYPNNPVRECNVHVEELKLKGKSHLKLNNQSCFDVTMEKEEDIDNCKRNFQSNDTSITKDENSELDSNCTVHRYDPGLVSNEFMGGIECLKFPILCLKQEKNTEERYAVSGNNAGFLLAKRKLRMSEMESNEEVESHKRSAKTPAQRARECGSREGRRGTLEKCSREEVLEGSGGDQHPFASERGFRRRIVPDVDSSRSEQSIVVHAIRGGAVTVQHSPQWNETVSKPAAQRMREHRARRKVEVGIKTKDAPKTSTERSRHCRARKRVLKCTAQKGETVANSCGDRETLSRNGLVAHEEFLHLSESDARNAKRGPKSAAQRAREYRARKKLKLDKMAEILPKTFTEHSRIYKARDSCSEMNALSSFQREGNSYSSEPVGGNIIVQRCNVLEHSAQPSDASVRNAESTREYSAREETFDLDERERKLPKSAAERAREYRAREKILLGACTSFRREETIVNSRICAEIAAQNSPVEDVNAYQHFLRPNETIVTNMKSGLKSAAHHALESSGRKKLKRDKKVKKLPKTPAERAREYRARKKVLKLKAVTSFSSEETFANSCSYESTHQNVVVERAKVPQHSRKPSEVVVRSTKPGSKSVAERMREYRARMKLKVMNMWNNLQNPS